MKKREQPPLEWLLDPVGRNLFFEKYWEKQPLVVNRQRPKYYHSLLSLDEIDRALTTLDLRYPTVVLKNSAREIAPEEYTERGDSLDVTRVYQLFEEGSTVTLAYLDTQLPSLTDLCRGLEAEFSYPFQANAYLTPPGNQGAKVHYDTHDVLVLQITGSKQWKIYGTPVESPLRDQDFDPAKHEPGEPTLEFELRAGDLAYVPRGWVHEARSTNEISLHLTVGILAYTWTDFFLEWVAEACLRDAEFRKTLPPGFARADFPPGRAKQIFARLLKRLGTGPEPDEILERFTDEFLSSCPPLLRGQMAQVASLDRLTTASVVGRRVHMLASLRRDADSVSVRCFGRKITFPIQATPALEFALSHEEFAVQDLPGNLDDSGKLTLVRRLIREGLLAARLA